MLDPEDDGFAVVPECWSIGRRIAVASLVFFGIGLLVFAAAGANGDGRSAAGGDGRRL